MLNKLFALTILSISLGANAASVTLYGDTVNYVYDDAQALGLFGTPYIQGDTVLFIPDAFRAASDGGEGQITATDNFIFDSVYSTNGMGLSEIKVTEDGDYDIRNGGDVSATLRLTLVNNDDFSAGGRNSLVNFSDSGDSGGAKNWDLLASIDPEAAYGEAVYDVRVSLQNTLTANTADGSDAAWIQKKLSFTAVSQVPVPAAAWLFGSALLGLVGVSRRKRA